MFDLFPVYSGGRFFDSRIFRFGGQTEIILRSHNEGMVAATVAAVCDPFGLCLQSCGTADNEQEQNGYLFHKRIFY